VKKLLSTEEIQQIARLEHRVETLESRPPFIIEEYAIGAHLDINGIDAILYKLDEDAHLVRILAWIVGGDGQVAPCMAKGNAQNVTRLISPRDDFRNLADSTVPSEYVIVSDATILEIPINQKFRQGEHVGVHFVTGSALDCSMILVFRRLVPIAKLARQFRGTAR